MGESVTGILYGVIIVLIIVVLWYVGIFDLIRSLIGAETSGKDLGKSVGEGAGAAVGSTIVGSFKSIVDSIKELTPMVKKQGEVCKMHSDCDGWTPGVAGTLGCCNETCQTLINDWAKVGFCPSECADRPFGKLGTCSSGYHWPRKFGEECALHTDCESVDGKPSGCQNSTCIQMKKDWAGVWYLPKDCVGAPFGAPGSCI